MANLSNIGRIFYGVSIAIMGILTINYQVLPYMLLPQQDLSFTGHVLIILISGAVWAIVGICTVLKKIIGPVSLLFGCILFLIFCFDWLPYQFIFTSNFKQPLQWDNPMKELAIAGGAFVIAGCFSEKNNGQFLRFRKKLIRLGSILFAIPILSFGILHFMYAKDVSTLVPVWVPYPVFWTYLAGIGLAGTGIAIITKIKTGLIATLSGTMILIWFIILHMPRVVAASFSDTGGEVTSAFMALAYSGTAFVIAGAFNSLSEKTEH